MRMTSTDLEERRLSIEQAKLRVEWWKVWLTPVSILASTIIGAVTVTSSFWSQQRRAEAEFQLEQRRAASEFELKAAEIVMNATGPTGTLNKARALTALFPSHFSADFASAFTPKNFQAAGLNPTRPQKLLELVSQHPEQKDQIIATWKRLFPKDSWVEAFE
jgi:hypothetical protein